MLLEESISDSVHENRALLVSHESVPDDVSHLKLKDRGHL